MTTNKKPAGSCNYQAGQSADITSLHLHHNPIMSRLKDRLSGVLYALPAIALGIILLAVAGLLMEALT